MNNLSAIFGATVASVMSIVAVMIVAPLIMSLILVVVVGFLLIVLFCAAAEAVSSKRALSWE